MPQARLKVIGITGGIGSGKSLVSTIFSELGAPTYNTDRSAKEIIVKNPKVKEAIIKLLGKSAYQADGSYNVDFVKEKVFNNSSLLSQLNSIVHPAVAKDFNQWLEQQDYPYVIKESALILKGSLEAYHQVIFCHTDEAERISRIQQRDPERSISEIEQIIKTQKFEFPKSDKLLILNNNREEAILDQILNLHKGFLN